MTTALVNNGLDVVTGIMSGFASVTVSISCIACNIEFCSCVTLYTLQVTGI